MEKEIKLSRYFFRFHYAPFVLSAVILTIFLPVYIGVENIGANQSMYVVERFFSLIGILLFFPLYLPDMEQNILSTIRSKTTPYLQLVLLRLIQVFVVTVMMCSLFLGVLKVSHAAVAFVSLFSAGMSIVLFLGGLMCLTFSVSRHPVPSVMLPILYYAVCLMSSSKYFGWFYLFTEPEGSLVNKVVLSITGILLISISLFLSKWTAERQG